jgi:AraC-like DNA-binding protein
VKFDRDGLGLAGCGHPQTVSVDDSVYREWRPPAALAAHVDCLWRRDAPSASAATVRVVPDGCADLMWQHAGGEVETLVAGPDSRVQFTELAAGTRMAGLRFAPGVASTVLGVPLDELRDQRVPLGELWGPVANELAEQGAAVNEPALLLAAAAQARISDSPDGSNRAIVCGLEAANGSGAVGRLAGELGMSERQLHRRCLTAFGYGPKVLQRVLRFQRALRLARAGGRLADVAAVSGYADQAHLARETRRLAGVPLTQLL